MYFNKFIDFDEFVTAIANTHSSGIQKQNPAFGRAYKQGIQ